MNGNLDLTPLHRAVAAAQVLLPPRPAGRCEDLFSWAQWRGILFATLQHNVGANMGEGFYCLRCPEQLGSKLVTQNTLFYTNSDGPFRPKRPCDARTS